MGKMKTANYMFLPEVAPRCNISVRSFGAVLSHYSQAKKVAYKSVLLIGGWMGRLSTKSGLNMGVACSCGGFHTEPILKRWYREPERETPAACLLSPPIRHSRLWGTDSRVDRIPWCDFRPQRTTIGMGDGLRWWYSNLGPGPKTTARA